MVLGTFPFWLKFTPITQIGLFIAVFLTTTTCFYFLYSLNRQVLTEINKQQNKKRLVIGSALLALLLTLVFRHEIPFSFSYSFTPQQIEISQPSASAGCSIRTTSNDFDIYIKPGMVLFHPFSKQDNKCSLDGQPSIRFNYFKNRLTTKPTLRYLSSVEDSAVSVNATTLQSPIQIDFTQSEKNSVNLVLIEDRFAYYAVYTLDLAFSTFCMILLFGLGWRLSSCIKKTGMSLLHLTARIIAIYTQKSITVKVLPVFLLIAAISLFAETALHALIWFLSLSSVIFTTLLLLAILKIKSWPAFVIGFFVLSYANILLVTQGAGLAEVLDYSLALIGFHFLIMTVVIILYWRTKKPPILPMLKKYTEEEILTRILGFSQQNPEIILLIAATAVVYLVIGLLTVLVPANIDDILTTYLPRAGYWLQQGSFRIWPTSDYNLPQVVYPLNGQLPLAWQIKLWGNDSLVGFLQYLSIPMGVAGIYGLARIMGASRKDGLFAALIFLGLPEVVILSSTALTDLLAANFIVAAIYLILKGIKDKDLTPLLLSSIALGISLGIKQTVFFIVPGIFILAVVILISERKKAFFPLLKWCGLVILTFLFFSSFMYIQNSILFRNPLGPSNLTPYFTHQDTSSSNSSTLVNGMKNTVTFLSRSFFDNLPTTILDGLNRSIFSNQAFQNSFRDSVPKNDYPISIAWSGQIGFLLLVITFFYSLYYSLKNKKWTILGVLLVVLINTLILLFIRKFTISSTRYFVMPLILLVSLIHLVVKNKTIQNIVIFNSIVMMIITLLFDGAKPLIGHNAIWGQSQNELRSLQFENTLPGFQAIDEYLPKDTVIGILLPRKFPQSYLFGINYSRKVISLDTNLDIPTLEYLQSHNIDYLLVDPQLLESGTSLLPLEVVSDNPELSFVIFKIPTPISPGME